MPEQVAGLEQACTQATATQAVAGIAMTHARHRQVHGEHQHPATGLPGLPQQRLHDAAVAQHVQLEPRRLRHRRADLVQRTDAHRRHGEGHASSFGRARGLDFAPARHHPGQAQWRQHQRHRTGLPGQVGGGLHAIDVHQHALAQAHPRPGIGVGAQGLLLAGTAIDVVEQEAWQPCLGQLPVILRAGRKARHHQPFPPTGPAAAMAAPLPVPIQARSLPDLPARPARRVAGQVSLRALRKSRHAPHFDDRPQCQRQRTRIAVMHDVSSFCNTRLSRGIQLALLLLLQTRALLRLDCRTMQGGFNTLPQ